MLSLYAGPGQGCTVRCPMLIQYTSHCCVNTLPNILCIGAKLAQTNSKCGNPLKRKLRNINYTGYRKIGLYNKIFLVILLYSPPLCKLSL